MSKHNPKKTYLGDGVYASHREDDAIELTTEDGISVTNTVVLEFEVWNNLVQYTCRVWPGED